MAKWKYTLNFKKLWRDYGKEKITIEELAQGVAKEIPLQLPLTDATLKRITKSFMKVKTVKRFDAVLARLYDWADVEVRPFGEWPRNAQCWVDTF